MRRMFAGRTVSTLGIVVLSASLAACGLGIDDADRLARAITAFEAADYPAAIVDLKSVLQNEPQNREARKYLGLASVAAGDFVEAEAHLDRAIALGEPIDELRVALVEARIENGKAEAALALAVPETAHDERDEARLWLLRGDALGSLDRIASALESYEQAARLLSPAHDAWLRAAETHWINGNSAAAQHFVDRVLAKAPSHLDALVLALLVAEERTQIEAAQRSLSEALEQSDAMTFAEQQALAVLAESELRAGHLESASARIEQLEAIWSAEDPDVQLLSAEAALRSGQSRDAVRILQSYLAYVDDPAAERLMGEAFFEQGLPNQAETHLFAAIRGDQDDVGARTALARLYLTNGSVPKARDTLQPVLALATDDTQYLSLLAFTGIDHPDAVAAFEQLDSGGPNLAGGTETQSAYELALGGIAALARGDTGDALARLAVAYESEPTNTGYRIGLLLSYIAADRYEEAPVIIGNGTDIDGNELFLSIARVALSGNGAVDGVAESDQHIARLTAWLETFPNDDAVRLALAAAHVGRGEYSAAAEQYEALLEAHEDDPIVLNDLAWCYTELGDARAIEYAQLAAELDRNSGAIADTLGWAMLAGGRIEESLIALREAVLLEPTNESIRMHLAEAERRAD